MDETHSANVSRTRIRTRFLRQNLDEIKAEAQRLDAKREDILAELKSVDESINSLNTGKQEVLATLKVYAKTLQIVDDLPQDILVAIFEQCAALYHQDPFLPLRIAQVCKLWRQLATACSCFWSNIIIGRRTPSLDLLELYLMRSNNVPLNIVIDHRRMRYGSSETQTISDRLALEAGRWKSLSLLSGSRRYFAKTFQNIAHMPLLVELHLKFDIHYGGLVDASWDNCTVVVPSARGLRRITLTGVPISAVRHSASCATSISWYRYVGNSLGLETELACLRGWEHLTELRLWKVHFPIPNRNGIVELPALSKLTWMICDLKDAAPIHFLDALICPVLTVLVIKRLPCDQFAEFLGQLLTQAFSLLWIMECHTQHRISNRAVSDSYRSLFSPLLHFTLVEKRTIALVFDSAGSHAFVTHQLQSVTVSFVSLGDLVEFVGEFADPQKPLARLGWEGPTIPFHNSKALTSFEGGRSILPELARFVMLTPQ